MSRSGSSPSTRIAATAASPATTPAARRSCRPGPRCRGGTRSGSAAGSGPARQRHRGVGGGVPANREAQIRSAARDHRVRRGLLRAVGGRVKPGSVRPHRASSANRASTRPCCARTAAFDGGHAVHRYASPAGPGRPAGPPPATSCRPRVPVRAPAGGASIKRPPERGPRHGPSLPYRRPCDQRRGSAPRRAPASRGSKPKPAGMRPLRSSIVDRRFEASARRFRTRPGSCLCISSPSPDHVGLPVAGPEENRPTFRLSSSSTRKGTTRGQGPTASSSCW